MYAQWVYRNNNTHLAGPSRASSAWVLPVKHMQDQCTAAVSTGAAEKIDAAVDKAAEGITAIPQHDATTPLFCTVSAKCHSTDFMPGATVIKGIVYAQAIAVRHHPVQTCTAPGAVIQVRP